MKRIFLFLTLLTTICYSEKSSEQVILEYYSDFFRDSDSVLCTDPTIIKKFEQIMKNLGIKDKILLNESQKKLKQLDACSAFYVSLPVNKKNYHAIVILQPYFSQQSEILQDFIFYHELRHHIQETVNYAQGVITEYMKNLDLSYQQAREYDADIFALQAAAKNCPDCIREIGRHYSFDCIDLHDAQGYITKKSIQPFLNNALKNPCVCEYHKAMSLYSKVILYISWYF